MNASRRRARAGAKLLVSTLALTAGCASDLATGPTRVRPDRRLADVSGASVVSVASEFGPLTVDVGRGVIYDASGTTLTLDASEAEVLAAEFTELEAIDRQANGIANFVPPDPCPYPSEKPSRGCFVNDARVRSGAGEPVRRGRPTPNGGTRSAAWPPSGVPGLGVHAMNDGWGVSCREVYDNVRANLPAWQTARRDYLAAQRAVTWLGSAVSSAGIGLLTAEAKDWWNTPADSVHRWKKVKEYWEHIYKDGTKGQRVLDAAARSNATAIVVGVVGTGLTATFSNYQGQAGRMAFLVTLFNSYGCGTKLDWASFPGNSGGGGGGSGGDGAGGSGNILIICRRLDHYYADGTYWYTETLSCQMQMT